MSVFEYAVLDKKGRVRKGVLEGDTPRQVRQQLREQGLSPLSIEEVTRTITRRKQSRVSLSTTDLALVTRQLATLVRSGLAIEEILRAVAEQARKPRLRSLLLAVRSRVLEGHSLAEGLHDFPNVFNELYRATIAAGEQSGHLEVVLERLADYTENRQQMRQKTLLALFYPLLLTIMAILVVIGLLTYVVPQVVQVFQNIHQELPWLTRALIALSDFLREWGIWIIGLLGIVFVTITRLLQSEQILFTVHRFLFRIPLVGRLEQGANVARFTRTLSILIASGISVLEALHIAAQVVSNRFMRQAVVEASNRVREGSNLHSALEQCGLFPHLVIYLIASGEISGDLEGMLERAAITQERELETFVGVLLGLFEPLLILLMGGIVLIIVLAILMPIFELNQLIQ